MSNSNTTVDMAQNGLLPAVPSYEEVTSEILKWADDIGLPSGYDEDLEKLYKRLSVLWHIR